MRNIIEIFFKRYRLYSCVAIVLIFLAISYLIYINSDNKVKASDGKNSEIVDIVKNEAAKLEDSTKIKVDVKGLVTNPGVYELNEGSRVIDAINLAGGLIDGADTGQLNLSKILKDENVIIVVSGEAKEENKVVEYVYQECDCKDFNDACMDRDNVVNYQKSDSNSSDNSDLNSLISINTATSDELQIVKGIGESKASAIIKYRDENGPFNNIEDIKNVPGIGDALFEKIKEFITI